MEHKTYLIKPFCNWEKSDVLVKKWIARFADDRENCKSENIQFTTGEKVDYYIIFNSTDEKEYIPEKTIVFFLEPNCNSYYQTWGLKTWKFVHETIKKEPFLQIRTHDKHIPFLTWQLDKTSTQLKNENIEKTGVLSTIMSSKYFDPGHIVRVETLREIDNSDLDIHIYGHDNKLNFKKYKGPHAENNKNNGILPYKYHLHCENNKEKNFITEKIWEGLLAECVLFYWGCPNIEEYVDPQCYIYLCSNNYKNNLKLIKDAINNNEWDKRIDIIRREKQRVLSQYSLFKTLSQIIKSVEEQPIDIWIYCVDFENGIENAKKQVISIKKTSLYNRIRNIFIGVVGVDVPVIDDHKVIILHFSPFLKHESFVINSLIDHLKNGSILYLKTYVDEKKLTQCMEKIEPLLYSNDLIIYDSDILCLDSKYLHKIRPHILYNPNFWMMHPDMKYTFF